MPARCLQQDYTGRAANPALSRSPSDPLGAAAAEVTSDTK